ncbi:MAG: NADH-quinone oxidoreductase subunit H [Actinobacteria bacterium]|nr:NADH-quinone oxidoreductase subunit H [Actinomycetota bacterium]
MRGSEILANLILILIQFLLILGLAPLVQGIIKTVKARLQFRQGPGPLQPYYDLVKYFKKDAVVSEHSSWVFRASPSVTFAAVAAAGALVPVLWTRTPFSFAGDLLAVTYLFALGRFFTALAGLDAGSAFGGMGSSREMTVSSLVEPALLLSLFVLALTAGSGGLGDIASAVARGGPASLTLPHLLALIGFAIVAIAEMGRIPVDNPDTHLELTMIHEGMLLEFSGKYLGLANWAAWSKQMIILAIIADVFLPWGIAAELTAPALALSALIFAAKMVVLSAIFASVEASFAKMRLFKVPALLSASFALSLLALVFKYTVGG